MTDSIRILLVSLESDRPEAAASSIEREDDRFDVAVEPTPEDGFERFADGDIDCIVSGGGTGDRDGDGLAFLETIREIDPTVPFLLFTGAGSEELASEAISRGVTDYVRKTGRSEPYAVLADRILAAVEGTPGTDSADRAVRADDSPADPAVYRTVVETAPGGVVALDTAGTIELLNDRAAELLGADRAELLGKPIRTIVTEDQFADAFRDWYPDTTGDRSSAVDAEATQFVSEFIAPDSDSVPVDIRLALRHSNGTWTGASGLIRDVADRTKRERRLERLHEATRDLIEADSPAEIATRTSRVADTILDLPMNGVHIYEEDAGGLIPIAVTGQSQELLEEPPVLDSGIGWNAFVSGEPRIHGDLREIDAVYNPETPMRSEICLPIGDHGVFIASATEVNAFDETDVTMAKLLVANAEAAFSNAEHERDLQRHNERLETVISIFSHDLRNPLNLAFSRVELARQQTERELEPLAKAETALNRIDRLIEDTLEFTRDGQTIGETEPIELDEFARNCWARLDAPRATLEIAGPPAVTADPDALRRVFANLYRNAVTHGGEAVTVRVGSIDGVDGFYVEDDGPGIPEERQSEVFEPGYTTAEDGTGFGLASVEEIVDAHDWAITVSDGSNGGARFEITQIDAD